jgi:hypothetical protein
MTNPIPKSDEIKNIIESPQDIDDYDQYDVDDSYADRNELTNDSQLKPNKESPQKKKGGRSKSDSFSQCDTLLRLANDAELFHTADGRCYADVIVRDHRETYALRRKEFALWLSYKYYQESDSKAPSSESFHSAINSLEAKGRFASEERPVFTRVGGDEEAAYFDLGNSDWEVVQITKNGWEIITDPPIRFQRSSSMLRVPRPIREGHINALKPFVNVRSDNDFVLVVAWILAALRHTGPYPVMVITGEQGSAKSTFCKFIKKLIDPHKAALRSLPKNNQDLFIGANNAHVLAFDNVSIVSDTLSDSFCRLATGGGFATRELYSDSDEIIFDSTKPIVLNGITQFIARPDLADRAIFIDLQSIPEDKRRPESEVIDAFEQALPEILGGFFNAMVVGINHLPTTNLQSYPRMADFAKWISACEKEIWPEGTFMATYSSNRKEANSSMIEYDFIASAIQSLIAEVKTWEGTATELLNLLNIKSDPNIIKDRGWPKTPSSLSKKLKRATTILRQANIDVHTERVGHERNRIIKISSNLSSQPKSADEVSATSSTFSGSANKSSMEEYLKASRGQ